MIYSLHPMIVWFLQAICLPEWSLLLPSIFASYVSKSRTGRSNNPTITLLAFCRKMKSAVHVPYAGWLILSFSALACTHDLKNFLSSIQLFCFKNFTKLWFDISFRRLCVQSSMSSRLHHLDHRLSVIICLQALVSFSSCFGTSFSADPLRISSLTLILKVAW